MSSFPGRRVWFRAVQPPVWCLLLVAGVLLPGTAFGQGAPDSLVGGRYHESEVKAPYLGEHLFSPNSFVPGPFINTFIRNTLGIGSAGNVVTPIIEIDDNTILGLQGDLLYASLGFEYQQAIKSWIAARGNIRVIGRLGTDVQALLADGITTVTGYEFGWLIKLLRTDRVMLSGDLMLANRNFTLLNVLGMIEDIVDGIPPSLTRKTPALRASGGLRFAWSVSPLFGATAMGNLGYGEAVIRTEEDEFYTELGVMLDFDLRAKTPVPIGLALGYRYIELPQGSEDIATHANGGLLRISYNGRSDFNLGLEIAGDRTKSPRFSEPFTTLSALIDFRYFF